MSGGSSSKAGYSVAAAGDVNGDGLADMIVGAPAVSSNAGRSYLVYGSSSFSSSVSLGSANTDVTFSGQGGGDYSGYPGRSAGRPTPIRPSGVR